MQRKSEFYERIRGSRQGRLLILVDEPLEEVRTAGDTLRLRLRDGRTGVLYLEDGEPRLVLPGEI